MGHSQQLWYIKLPDGIGTHHVRHGQEVDGVLG